MKDILIMKLYKSNKEDVLQVANILYEWWGKKCGLLLEDLIEIVIERCGGKNIPVTYIAKISDEVIGTVSFIENDASLNPDIYPMISGLYVKEKYRNNSIATKLLCVLIDDVSKLKDFQCVYLTTNLSGFYEKFGFQFMSIIDTNVVNNVVCKEKLYKLIF